MKHINFPLTPEIKARLKHSGVVRLRKVKVRAESYRPFLEKMKSAHPELPFGEHHALAILCCLTHPDHKSKHKRWPLWYWLVGIGLVLALLFAAKASAQTSQIDVITFQDNTASIIKSFAAPFRIQCGLNLTCTASGSVMTITGAAAGTTHTILSATHSDTTPAAAVRGDGFFAIGSTPTWQRLAHPATTGGYFKWNGTDVVTSSLAAAGTGTPTACSNQFVTGFTLNADAVPVSTCTTVPYSAVSGTPAVPTGTGFSHVTSGSLDVAAKTVDVSSADTTGVLKAASFPALTGDITTVAGALATTLATVATPGTSPKVTFNAKGLVTSGTTLVSGDIPNNAANTSGLAGTATALAANGTNCSPGNYPLGVDAQGNAESCTAASGSGTVTHTAGALTLNQLIFGNGSADIAVGDLTGDVTTSGGKATTLATVATPGTGLKTTVNAKGLVTAVATAASTDLSDTAVIMRTNANQTMSAGTTLAMDTFSAKYWGAARFDASLFGVGDWCARNLNVLSDALYILAPAAIIDSQRLTGSQTCALGSTVFSATKPTHWLLGQMTLSLPNSGVSFLDVNGVHASLAAPAAPTLATATTGGSLAAATTYGVKVAYCNLTGTTVGSSETTQLTGAGTTNSITVTSPINSSSLQAYNVYSATPVGSGWKLNNTTGCIPLGTSYVIKTVGAGAIPLATGTAWEGMMEIEGQGDSTVISEDSVNSPFLISSNNVHIHHLKFVSSQTTNNNGTLWIDSSNDIEADHLTFAGGGNGIFINASNRVKASTVHCGKLTISGSCIAATNSSNVSTRDVAETDTVLPAGGNLQGVVNFNGCTDCSTNGTIARNNDMSNITNAAAVIVDGASLRTNINDTNCDGLINSDCIVITGMSLNANISNTHCAFTTVGTGAGVGANANNGDCLDLFNAARIGVTNSLCQSMGLIGGLRFPCYEFFDSSEISATNISAFDSSGEGVKLFGCTGCSITGSHFNRNGKSGILLVDSATVVTCNNTTTVTYVSGNGFGPWPPGTTVNIGAGPTAFQLASAPTSTTTLTLTAACNLGASQAFSVFTQDTQLTANQTDDNGTGLQGANTQSGIDILGSSNVNINGGSANDNRATASKTQMFGINAGATTASFSTVNFDPSSNLGGTCTNELGPAAAGNHWICDLGKKSTLLLHNGATPTWLIAPASTNGASLNFPAGVAPTTPVPGDFWNDATAMAYRDPTSGINQYLPKKIYLTGNYTNSTTGLTNVTSGNTLAFAVAASKDYLITCELFYQAASTGGLQIGFTGPASPTAVNYSAMIGTTATTINNGEATAFATKIPAVGVAATATTNFPAHIALMLRNGVNAGTVTLQAASVAAVQLTINNTSTCSIW